MRRPKIAHATCEHCGADNVHVRFPDGTWTISITVLPDEHFYLTHRCSHCDQWSFTRIPQRTIEHLTALWVPIEDLSLVDAGVCRRSIAPPNAAEAWHMWWLANEAEPNTLRAVMSCAVDQILGRHPAGGTDR